MTSAWRCARPCARRSRSWPLKFSSRSLVTSPSWQGGHRKRDGSLDVSSSDSKEHPGKDFCARGTAGGAARVSLDKLRAHSTIQPPQGRTWQRQQLRAAPSLVWPLMGLRSSCSRVLDVASVDTAGVLDPWSSGSDPATSTFTVGMPIREGTRPQAAARSSPAENEATRYFPDRPVRVGPRRSGG